MKTHRIFITISFFVCAGCINFGQSRDITHKIQQREDGGYEITLKGTKRLYQPVTVEGPFPVQSMNYKILLKGKGKEWSFRNQPGYYYSFPKDIESATSDWDLGYAWVDKNRETVFLNFYWVKAPDSLIDSDVNGVYRIQP